MRIISKKTLVDFWNKYTDSEQSLKAWFSSASTASWKQPSDVKALYKNASILKNNRVVFNIHGNKYRLIVKIDYQFGTLFIKFIGTHKQYDNIDANEVNYGN